MTSSRQRPSPRRKRQIAKEKLTNSLHAIASDPNSSNSWSLPSTVAKFYLSIDDNKFSQKSLDYDKLETNQERLEFLLVINSELNQDYRKFLEKEKGREVTELDGDEKLDIAVLMALKLDVDPDLTLIRTDDKGFDAYVVTIMSLAMRYLTQNANL